MTDVSWVPDSADSPFPVQHLPYGVFSRDDESPRVGVAIGPYLVDLAPLAASEWVDFASVFDAPTLNPFMSLGSDAWHAVRHWLTVRLTDEAFRDLVEPELVPLDQVRLHMPFQVGDFVDFYASEHHASNLGTYFRPDSPPLLPNWKHLPVGYHGRSATVAMSGTPVVRPRGQQRPAPDHAPTFGPTAKLDIEAELGFVVGTSTKPGQSVSVDCFADHVFGVVLVNDWTARDIQAWEYQPLGPFLGKSFLTSVSAWVTPLAALDAARLPCLEQHPEPLEYLQGKDNFGFDIELEVSINGNVVARPPYREMYWTPAQMLAHLTVNGASVRTGDLFASGTVSGADRDTAGSLIELSRNGSEPIELPDGSTRTFLEDGDEVVLRASAPGVGGVRITLGEVSARVEPAPPA